MAQSGSFAGNLSPSVIPSCHNSPALPPHPPHKHTRYKTHSRYALFIQRGRSIPFSMCEHLAWFGSSWLPWRAGRGRTTRTRRRTRRRRRGLSSLTPLAEHGTHQRLKGAEATFFLWSRPKSCLNIFSKSECTTVPPIYWLLTGGRGNCNQFK